jgi:acyl-CoA synthetase (AMP-forming)/AMP-acid ligase II
MFDATTLTQILESNRGVSRKITYLDGEKRQRDVSFAELHARAYGILYHLQRFGLARGDKLILFLPDNELFIDAFWASILGGIIPVPVAFGRDHAHRYKLLRIAHALPDAYFYTERTALAGFGESAAAMDEAQTFARVQSRTFVVDDLDDISRPGNPCEAQPEDVALIQFSSGSTSDPKGIVLTHRNILSNARAVAEAARFDEHDVSLSWMPLAHDFGLIGFHVFMLANRIHSHLMSTELFVRRPLLWLRLATRIRATLLCSPNFGYRHYLKALRERPIDDLDLSSVRLIFNGAEPISVELCERFLNRLGPAGLAHHAMFPVYGLAEATLAVTFPEPGQPCKSLTFNRHHLRIGDWAEPSAPADKSAVTVISVGRTIPRCRLRIADERNELLRNGQVGQIQISGDNVTRGYYENIEANMAAFTADGWLCTGDLGLVHDDELYICGRAKEVIIVNGENYYAHDLETIALQAEGLELGRVAAIGVRPSDAEVDHLLFCILHRADLRDFLSVAERVARLIYKQTGLTVNEVIPVTQIPKTTSGKIQRYLLETRYLAGEFDDVRAQLRSCRAALGRDAFTSDRGIEEKLITICEKALGGRNIAIYDNLVQCGLSSLQLTELHLEIDRHFPGAVEITDMIDFPTIADLAGYLATRLGDVCKKLD